MSEIKRLTVEEVETWPHFQGKRETIKFLKGQPLSHKEAILSACYLCMSGYDGGAQDCRGVNCPLYVYQPYRPKEGNTNRKVKVISEEHKAKLKAGREKKEKGTKSKGDQK